MTHNLFLQPAGVPPCSHQLCHLQIPFSQAERPPFHRHFICRQSQVPPTPRQPATLLPLELGGRPGEVGFVVPQQWHGGMLCDRTGRRGECCNGILQELQLEAHDAWRIQSVRQVPFSIACLGSERSPIVGLTLKGFDQKSQAFYQGQTFQQNKVDIIMH